MNDLIKSSKVLKRIKESVNKSQSEYNGANYGDYGDHNSDQSDAYGDYGDCSN